MTSTAKNSLTLKGLSKQLMLGNRYTIIIFYYYQIYYCYNVE